MKNARNIAIVLGLAAAVFAARRWQAEGTGVVVDVLWWTLNVIFLGVLAWFVYVMYRQYRPELLSMSDRMRAVLYGSAGLVVLTLTATSLLWSTGPGTVIWFALIAAAAYGFVATLRAYRRY